MVKQFLYSVTTKLDQSQVWELLTDIENWTRMSPVYQQLAWEGEPWVCGSSIVGTILYPTKLHFRYVLREFQPLRSSVTWPMASKPDLPANESLNWKASRAEP